MSLRQVTPLFSSEEPGSNRRFQSGGAVGIGLLVSCRAETSHHGQQPLSTDGVWVDVTAEYAPRH